MEELYFIKAEAYYWKGDKTKACELAKEATRANIERHLAAFQKAHPEVMYPGNMTASGYVKLDARDKDGDLTKSKYYWDAIVDAFLDDATMPEKDEKEKQTRSV